MNYYNAILQNLFFATLNQQRKDRKFVKDENIHTNREEYGVKTLYRYKNKFLISEKEILELFKDIPFLNGGLFDCLDKIDESGKVIYIDVFRETPKKKQKFPTNYFLGQRKKA
jgi:adenine-specific DNA-methyltransferase